MRSTGVSGRIACGFQTELNFANEEEELKANKGWKKQAAFLFKSPEFGLSVAAIKQPNPRLTAPFQMPLAPVKHRNRINYISERCKGPKIRERQTEYYQQDTIAEELAEVIIFGRK